MQSSQSSFKSNIPNSGPFAKDLISQGPQEVLLPLFVPQLYLEEPLLSLSIDLVVNKLITLSNGEFPKPE